MLPYREALILGESQMSNAVQEYIAQQVSSDEQRVGASTPIGVVSHDEIGIVIVCNDGAVWRLDNDGWEELASVPNSVRDAWHEGA